ncbi:MAG: DUF3558 domain-containing protein [Kutzneria sp.]|nr:DUF3558 domain-containing protein [Kutzneria sp.]MBV9846873.1 DUF3558 domain-containing protein [Kutzneria sp.]
MTARLGVVGAAVFAALAGTSCTSANGEQPTSTTATSSVSIPSRPRDISLDNVDPCTLLTESQRAQLGISRMAQGPDETQTPAPTCAYQVRGPGGNNEGGYTLGLSPESKRGINDWLNGNGTVNKRLISVSGFPAVQLISMNSKWDNPTGEFCTTNVSTADGQELSMDLEPHGKSLTQPQMCDLSKQAAELALATLQTLKK